MIPLEIVYNISKEEGFAINNLCQIQFNTFTGGKKYPHTIIYNKTQITEDEVYQAIWRGTWRVDNRIAEVNPGQYECLLDKEEDNMEKKIIELTKIDYECSCLLCCERRATTKFEIKRVKYNDGVIGFDVCDKCLSKMQEDIQKTCE